MKLNTVPQTGLLVSARQVATCIFALAAILLVVSSSEAEDFLRWFSFWNSRATSNFDALAINGMPLYGYTAGEAKAAIDALGYSTLPRKRFVKAQAIADAPGKNVWYSWTDGSETAIGYGGQILSMAEIPTGLHYKFVFLNACWVGKQADNWKSAFGAEAFAGWNKRVENVIGRFPLFGRTVFEKLKGHVTVRDAIDAALSVVEGFKEEDMTVIGETVVVEK